MGKQYGNLKFLCKLQEGDEHIDRDKLQRKTQPVNGARQLRKKVVWSSKKSENAQNIRSTPGTVVFFVAAYFCFSFDSSKIAL